MAIGVTLLEEYAGGPRNTLVLFDSCLLYTSNGPKNGMMFVTPTTTLMSIAYGMCSAVIPTNHRMPRMRESSSLPWMKPPNTR